MMERRTTERSRGKKIEEKKSKGVEEARRKKGRGKEGKRGSEGR